MQLRTTHATIQEGSVNVKENRNICTIKKILPSVVIPFCVSNKSNDVDLKCIDVELDFYTSNKIY